MMDFLMKSALGLVVAAADQWAGELQRLVDDTAEEREARDSYNQELEDLEKALAAVRGFLQGES